MVHHGFSDDMMADFRKTLLPVLTMMGCYLQLNIGIVLMLRLVMAYSQFEDDVEFLLQKQAYLHLKVWKVAFYIHVFTSVFTLLAGFTQFSATFLKKHQTLHRRLGYLYVINVLCLNVPAGLVMGIHANGLWPSKLAFLLLDGLWFYFTLKAVSAARSGHFRVHRDHMIRSYALTLSALTLRTWKVFLTATTDFSPEAIYMIDAWLGFVPNLIIAEWLIARLRRSSTPERNKISQCHCDPNKGDAETG